MIRPAANSARLVFRLWPSATVLCATDGTAHPLMLASVVEETFARVIWTLTVFESRPASSDVPEALREALPGAHLVHSEPSAAADRLLLARADTVTIADRQGGAPAATVAEPSDTPVGCRMTGSSPTH